jgi:hypothetical protein
MYGTDPSVGNMLAPQPMQQGAAPAQPQESPEQMARKRQMIAQLMMANQQPQQGGGGGGAMAAIAPMIRAMLMNQGGGAPNMGAYNSVPT